MNQLTLWRLASALLALALLFAISQATAPDRWVEAQAQNRARELAEIDAEGRLRPGEDSYAYALRRSHERGLRAELCRQPVASRP
jgi:hypothetical protein